MIGSTVFRPAGAGSRIAICGGRGGEGHRFTWIYTNGPMSQQLSLQCAEHPNAALLEGWHTTHRAPLVLQGPPRVWVCVAGPKLPTGQRVWPNWSVTHAGVKIADF